MGFPRRQIRIGAAMPCTVYFMICRPCSRGAGCAVGPDKRWIAFLRYQGGGFVHSEAAATVVLSSTEARDLYKRSLAGLVQEARSVQIGEGSPFCTLPGRRSRSSRGPPIE